MSRMNIGIVGLGSLGSALYEGLTRSGVMPSDVIICELPEKVREVSEKTGSAVTADIDEAASFADVICLAVKGHVFDEYAPRLKQETIRGKTFLSFMAGVPTERLRGLLPGAEIVRVMPSLAIAMLDGVVAHTACSDEIAAILSKLGYAFEVAHEDVEKVTAFSSCGLGFAAYMIGALSRAGQELGFTRGQADMIAARTFENACKNGGGFDELVASVATKGGATEQGVLHFDACDLRGIVSDAVKKAYERVK